MIKIPKILFITQYNKLMMKKIKKILYMLKIDNNKICHKNLIQFQQ